MVLVNNRPDIFTCSYSSLVTLIHNIHFFRCFWLFEWTSKKKEWTKGMTCISSHSITQTCFLWDCCPQDQSKSVFVKAGKSQQRIQTSQILNIIWSNFEKIHAAADLPVKGQPLGLRVFILFYSAPLFNLLPVMKIPVDLSCNIVFFVSCTVIICVGATHSGTFICFYSPEVRRAVNCVTIVKSDYSQQWSDHC